MSTYWHLHCKKCKDELQTYANSDQGERLMLLIIKHREAFEILAKMVQSKTVYDYNVKFNGEGIGLEFFLKHKGHDIIAVNEYGQTSHTECAKCKAANIETEKIYVPHVDGHSYYGFLCNVCRKEILKLVANTV